MRFLILAAALLLSGCWIGDGLYSNSDSQQPIPAGIYRGTSGEKIEVEKVTLLANGLTEIGDGDGKGLYGFAPLDQANGRFVVWFRQDEETRQDRAQVYLLLERRSTNEFVFYWPQCKGELAEIARKAGATVGQEAADTCRFPTRASLEKAMRQVQISGDMFRLVRIAEK
jgi:hypothetical protein